MRDVGLMRLVLSLGLGLTLLVGCEQQGPAQKAGEKVTRRSSVARGSRSAARGGR